MTASQLHLEHWTKQITGNTQHNTTIYGFLEFVRDNPGKPVPEEGTFCHFRIFWSKMKITEADTPTIRMDCHPIQTNWCPISANPTIFTSDALPGTTLSIYPGLGQAPNMLACIPVFKGCLIYAIVLMHDAHSICKHFTEYVYIFHTSQYCTSTIQMRVLHPSAITIYLYHFTAHFPQNSKQQETNILPIIFMTNFTSNPVNQHVIYSALIPVHDDTFHRLFCCDGVLRHVFSQDISRHTGSLSSLSLALVSSWLYLELQCQLAFSVS